VGLARDALVAQDGSGGQREAALLKRQEN
jgi:hypothetical protein